MISIIIPAYNAASTIAQCLQALQQQTYPDSYEIIVVNDGSHDKTAEIAQSFGVTLLHHDSSRGAAAARNTGIHAATGQIIGFTDADCAPQPNWLTQLAQPFSNPEIAGCKGIYASQQKEIVARFVQIEYEDRYDLLHDQAPIDFIDTYSAAYRRHILIENDGFDERIAYVEDQELSFRLAARGYQMIFQPTAVVNHYHSPTLAAYWRKKFKIGYWKAQVIRRFPQRAIKDSHTPPILKVQLLLMAAVITTLVGLLLTPWSGLLFGLSLIAFLFTTFPFLSKAAKKDRAVALVAPVLLAARALALGLGYAWGLFKPNPHLIRGEESTIGGLSYWLKRLMDIVTALAGLAVTFLISPFIALAIKLDSPGPIIFRQERVGQGGRPFTVYKFRSMQTNAQDLSPNPATAKLRDDPRLTRVGQTLRRWSLDELPQFWNILRGDMSLIGPRPEESHIVAHYSAWHRRRLAVKPGLTGPMQVNGRADLPLDERVQLELNYIDHYTFWQDLRILAQTIPAVLKGTGAR